MQDHRYRDGVSEEATRRRLLALAKPPKPIGEMSDDERRAFAAELFEVIKAKMFGDAGGPAVDDSTP